MQQNTDTWPQVARFIAETFIRCNVGTSPMPFMAVEHAQCLLWGRSLSNSLSTCKLKARRTKQMIELHGASRAHLQQCCHVRAHESVNCCTAHAISGCLVDATTDSVQSHLAAAETRV